MSSKHVLHRAALCYLCTCKSLVLTPPAVQCTTPDVTYPRPCPDLPVNRFTMPVYARTQVCVRRPRAHVPSSLAFARAPAPAPARKSGVETVSAGIGGAVRFVDSGMRRFVASNSFKYLVAGALAGIVSRTVVSPLEVVATVNMCTSGASKPLLTELRVLFQEEGMKGFFKGNAANCLKVAPTKGIQFVAFEAFKRALFRARERRAARGNLRSRGPLSPLERLVAGGVAGMAAAVCCYPLEVAKTLLTAHPEKYSGVLGTLRQVVRAQGPKGLYRGLLPTLIAMFPYVGLEFMVYEQLKLVYERRRGEDASVVHMLLIGALAGSLAQTTCHPLDVIRKRLQLQGVGGRPIQYKSMLDATLKIVRQEGPNALYRGLQPMYVSAVPSAGVSYAVYEATKNVLGVTSFR